VSQIVVKQERVVPASPETVYTLLADYKIQRPKLLTPNFLDYTVEKGGKGSGTVVSYRLHSANRERLYRMHIDEPVKGEVLTERDSNSSLVTTWSLFPVRSGALTRVRITTEWQGHGGVGGFFEKTFAPLGLRSIYGKMLDALVHQIPGAAYNIVPGEDKGYNAGSNLSGLFLVVSLVLASIFGIRYLFKKR
jgi:hypothetical protein